MISFSIAPIINGSMCVIEFLLRDLISHKQEKTLLHTVEPRLLNIIRSRRLLNVMCLSNLKLTVTAGLSNHGSFLFTIFYSRQACDAPL